MTNQFLPSIPDWGIYPNQLPGNESDLGEVAARLGGLSTYRRTGRLIWQADFVSLSGWEIGAGAVVTPSVTQVYNSVASLKLTSGDIFFTHPRVVETAGLEVALYPQYTGAGFPDSTFIYYYADPRMFGFYIDWNSTDIFRTDMMGWVKVCDIPPVALLHYPWHNFKFTMDIANENYGWMYYDDISINLSAYKPDMSAIGLNGDLIQLTNVILPGQSAAYFSNLIITTNEVVT